MIYYPAFLNLKGKRVLLFGGGQVALRKARALVKSGASLVAISRDFAKPFLQFARRNGVKIQYGSIFPKMFGTVSLVIAATSDTAFNRKVYEKCKQENIFVNVVDDPKCSTFIVPSILRRGLLQIAISTGGASPFLAKMLRKKLAGQFGVKYGGLVKQLGQDRSRTKRLISFPKERRNHFQRLVESRLKVLDGKNLKRPSLRGNAPSVPK